MPARGGARGRSRGGAASTGLGGAYRVASLDLARRLEEARDTYEEGLRHDRPAPSCSGAKRVLERMGKTAAGSSAEAAAAKQRGKGVQGGKTGGGGRILQGAHSRADRRRSTRIAPPCTRASWWPSARAGAMACAAVPRQRRSFSGGGGGPAGAPRSRPRGETASSASSATPSAPPRVS